MICTEYALYVRTGVYASWRRLPKPGKWNALALPDNMLGTAPLEAGIHPGAALPGQLSIFVMLSDDFYVVAHEPGAEHPALPTWANRSTNPLALAAPSTAARVQRIDLPQVPGAYHLLNVLSVDECCAFIDLSEALGYLEDAAVSLPRSVRHNDNVVWITDAKTDDIIWRRVADCCSRHLQLFDNKRPLGLNARFRFYRYREDDFFRAHTDGAWPGSRVVDGKLVANAFPDRYSQMTFLIFLSEDFEGGATRFMVGDDRSKVVDIRTPVGGALCFPHGMHPLHCVHSSEPILAGTKYIIRTDMLFEL